VLNSDTKPPTQLTEYEPDAQQSDVEERDRSSLAADARAVCERLAHDLGVTVYTASVCHSMVQGLG
jgi:hypothetical protein